MAIDANAEDPEAFLNVWIAVLCDVKPARMIKFIRKVSDFEQKKKQIDSNIESAQNVILSNCTKPRTGQLKNIGIWG